mgnify:CR=1 FL=1
MKARDVAAELRKAQAGTLEEKRLALARIKLARLRQAKAAATTRPANGLASLRLAIVTTDNPRAGLAAVRALMRQLDTDARRPRR